MTLVAPAPKGILDPRTGKPVGADDSFFTGMNAELADKGFLVTAAAHGFFPRKPERLRGRGPARRSGPSLG